MVSAPSHSPVLDVQPGKAFLHQARYERNASPWLKDAFALTAASVPAHIAVQIREQCEPGRVGPIPAPGDLPVHHFVAYADRHCTGNCVLRGCRDELAQPSDKTAPGGSDGGGRLRRPGQEGGVQAVHDARHQVFLRGVRAHPVQGENHNCCVGRGCLKHTTQRGIHGPVDVE
jgi:hypothetical protein